MVALMEILKAEGTLGSYVGHFAKTDPKERNGRGFEKTCSYCHKKGHFRADSYALKARTSPGSSAGQPKGACCTVSLPSGPAVTVTEQSESVLAAFLPFISNGYVSLVGSV